MFAYAGNNPIKYTDPDGRDTGSPYFNSDRYYQGILIAETARFNAAFQDLFGKIGNFFQSIFTKTKIEGYGEVEISFGPIAFSGTLTVDTKGNIEISFSNPEDMLIGEIEKIVNLPVTIDTSGISADIPFYKGLVDVNAVVGMEKGGDGNYKLKLGVKAGKEGKLPNGQKIGASAGAGVKITFRPSTEDGSFGTIKNRKNEKLNENVQKYEYYNSIEFWMDNWEE